jgi:transcriptional regulator with XRE-family HTH domain
MIDRIKKIMHEKGISAAVFADKISVNRGTVTHILTARNEPSLKVISKILEIYPDINSDWLLFGKQPMYRSEKVRIEPNLFSENPANPVNPAPVPKETKEIEDKPKEITSKKFMNQEITPQNLIPVYTTKKIDKIMVLYSDQTYETFSPD